MSGYDTYFTILPALAASAALLGVALLVITNTLRDAIPSKGQDALIIGALLSLVLRATRDEKWWPHCANAR